MRMLDKVFVPVNYQNVTLANLVLYENGDVEFVPVNNQAREYAVIELFNKLRVDSQFTDLVFVNNPAEPVESETEEAEKSPKRVSDSDYQKRREALDLASKVVTNDPSTTVERAKAYYDFLCNVENNHE